LRVALQALAASFIAFGLTLFTPPVLAAEYNVGDPCPAGFPDGMKHQKDDGSGNGITLVCDGGTFVLNTEITGTKTLLQINNDPNACTAAKEGRLRYDPGGDTWAYCDSAGNWTPLFGSICTNDASGECLLSATRSNGDPEFTATNIADGVNILGVTGSFTGTDCPSAPSAGLVGHWTFDDGAGSTTAADSSGLGNTGTLTNMDPSTDWVTGQVGGALEFDGTDDYVEVSRDCTLEPSDEFTVSAWFYWIDESVSNFGKIVAKTEIELKSPFQSYSIGQHQSFNDIEFELNVENQGYVFARTTLSLSTWHHLVLTFDGTQATAYIDGSTVGSVTTSGLGNTVYYYNTPLAIGNESSGLGSNNYVNGRIDDVRIYNYALTATEVNTLYNNGL
jgi:GH24 family phage-related lysozyme (muramidase)